jgi:hypothetical protein
VQPLAEHEWTQRTVPQHQAALRQLALIDALLSAAGKAGLLRHGVVMSALRGTRGAA